MRSATPKSESGATDNRNAQRVTTGGDKSHLDGSKFFNVD
jgi:hypothetical protein